MLTLDKIVELEKSLLEKKKSLKEKTKNKLQGPDLEGKKNNDLRGKNIDLEGKKKDKLVKALNEAGYRQSALLLKNWDKCDQRAKEFIEKMN